MSFFFMYGRRFVYTLALLWALALYANASLHFPTTGSALSTLMRNYALTALFLLYAVLTPGLIASFFPTFRFNSLLAHMRRALGVSVFFFAFLHVTIAFFHNLSGALMSVTFLSARNQWALVFSVTAFCIFSALALTSFNIMVKKLGKYWKRLHKLIYIAGILTVFHAFFIGSHFTVPINPIPIIVNILSLLFIILEVIATAKRTWRTSPGFTRKNVPLHFFLSGILIFAVYSSYIGFTSRYDPHAAHRRGYSQNYVLEVISEPRAIQAKTQTKLTFRVTDKRTGRPLARYQTLQEKLMHVVVLRKDLLSYDHIHPEFDGKDTFTVTHTFPTDGTYYLYVEYSPPDFYENLSVAKIIVGNSSDSANAVLTVDEKTKLFNDAYRVTLTGPSTIKANDTVDFSYTITDEKNGTPITDLETYLGAFGHMSAVREDMEIYTHVHPITVPLTASDLGGPTVQFSTFFPKSGKYKLFTQFKHKGRVFVTDFVVEVK